MLNSDTLSLFNQIYQSTAQKTLRLITSKCGNLSDIQDIFQETYEEVYSVLQKRGKDYIENPEAFVCKIAKRKIYRHYSLTQKLSLLIPLFSAELPEPETHETQIADPSASVEDTAEEHALLSEINLFLKTKPQEVQRIFYLFYGLDMSISEIAKQTSSKESNVKNKLYRTLKELRQQYHLKDGESNE